MSDTYMYTYINVLLVLYIYTFAYDISLPHFLVRISFEFKKFTLNKEGRKLNSIFNPAEPQSSPPTFLDNASILYLPPPPSPVETIPLIPPPPDHSQCLWSALSFS